ncbi:hypothetical protein B9Z65_6067 [Elsinoe australis]|uniref:Uncharacterized protein n=1 Tax=Elsinoe australis TaxID=40998 RepID=A0A2P8A7L7_9PEZI|nr:hypothetical protein B9Z65_6067 [Elsinoe australis]
MLLLPWSWLALLVLLVEAITAQDQLGSERFPGLFKRDGYLQPNNSRANIAPSGQIRFPSTATGRDYAFKCQSRHFSWSLAESSWSKQHEWIEKQTNYYGGSSWSVVTDYAHATTICDGHARVRKSPETPIRTRTTWLKPGQTPTKTSIELETVFSYYPSPSPTCTISPKDCDPLWRAYSRSMSAWLRSNPTQTLNGRAQITQAPQTPICMNQTAASSWSSVIESIYGCGDCTLYGDDVRLLFFPVPTTVSRDMCASTPLASMTHFPIDGEAIEVYAGKSYGQKPAPAGAVTATVDHHTLTSGTAYISIGQVYAQDRCSRYVGTTISNVIVAMHSESVLSLRYSQDHFQYFASSSTQTGYPVSYADFNHPVPWSAWNGMARCLCPGWGCRCDVIYEDEYRPQLAIPAAVRQLDPRWAKCQNWYGGLYDPPVTLQSQDAFAVPTFSASLTSTRTIAKTTGLPPMPAPGVQTKAGSTLQVPSTRALHPSLSSAVPSPGSGTGPMQSMPSASGKRVIASNTEHLVEDGSTDVSSQPSIRTITVNGQAYTITTNGYRLIISSQTISLGGPGVILANGAYASLGSSGLVIESSATIAALSSGTGTISAGSAVYTVKGQNGPFTIGSEVLSPGGQAVTLPNGMVATLGKGGIVVAASKTVISDVSLAATITSGVQSSSSQTSHAQTSTNPLLSGSAAQPFGASQTSSTTSKATMPRPSRILVFVTLSIIPVVLYMAEKC